MKRLLGLLSAFAMISFVGLGSAAASASGDGVFFENLTDGQTVKSPVLVKMGVSGKTVGPAGEAIDGVGHHHIVVDGSFVKAGETVPADENHIHFGKGQTETELTLKPGSHTLTLQFADGLHRSYGEA